MKRPGRLILTLFLLVLPGCMLSFAQSPTKVEQVVIFGKRINAPVKIEVTKDGDRLLFQAQNASQFKYELELEFNEFLNLAPYIGTRRTVLSPGLNRLFTLNVKDPQQPHHYSYTIRYTMGDPNERTDPTFPYLVPIAEGKILALFGEKDRKYTYCFALEQGDTIYASRTGYVTATINDDPNRVSDRINPASSIEVRHLDGTIAVYEGLDRAGLSVRTAQKIYAGQPLGIADGSEKLAFYLYEFRGEGRLASITPAFSIEAGQLAPAWELDGHTVSHPEAVADRELSRRELKKKQRGILY